MPKSKFEQLPTYPRSELSAYLPTKELSALARTSKENSKLFKPMLDVAKLLQHVARGEQDAAEAMLRRQPHLLIKKGRVTDYSDRTFHAVSAWQCMLWALDTRYMGQMMLSCVPAGKEGIKIRKEMLEQLESMQGGGSDIVRLVGTTDPRDIPLSDIEKLFGNDDALLFWDDQFFYMKRGHSPVVLLEPSVSDEEAESFKRRKTSPRDMLIVPSVSDEEVESFKRWKASLRDMPANGARKTTDEEHALITATLGYTLSRKGIHYEAPDMYTNVVKIDGVANPGDIGFHEIVRLFDNEDAILFWNDGFYHANKADSSVRPITPTVTDDNKGAFAAFKASFTNMPPHHSARQASPSEHALIKSALIHQGLSRKIIHYCDSHYDFGVIDALQTYIDRFDGLDWRRQDALWINQVAKAQMGMPANVLQHYCDRDKAFYPPPDFKAKVFRRCGQFYNWISDQWSNLFSGSSLNSGLGFQFGLTRAGSGPLHGSPGGWPKAEPRYPAIDMDALRELYKVRTDDAKQLQDNLCQSLKLAPRDPTGAGGPS